MPSRLVECCLRQLQGMAAQQPGAEWARLLLAEALLCSSLPLSALQQRLVSRWPPATGIHRIQVLSFGQLVYQERADALFC